MSEPIMICSRCGVYSDKEIRFCGQCGNSMSLMSDAERVFFKGCDIQAGAAVAGMIGDDEEFERQNIQAINLYEQSLLLGLNGHSEANCHWRIGNILYVKTIQTDYGLISKTGLQNLPNLSKAMNHLERAIFLDSQLGNPILSDREEQSELLKLDLVWGSQSSYIKNNYGYDAAISYLTEKKTLVQHLGVNLPCLFFNLGMQYAESGKIFEAKEMFRIAKNAEDYSDELSEDFWTYEIAQNVKKDSANNLEYLEIYGKAP